ncbi:uncharacterized protein MELLADRAFT_85626 [Melampsora larici-populina 98AG31]|uniref:Helicase ATP-binding domain-containing protein n=1 Tax=Melampsora larici-populina (strain 98AG31 / pathotype 3-4-7) TaxID=747676 RepID=F4RJ81_MELLP|nr:uncharacterized protein MELLADRAFT_85626 [Melampsora larici-populina 98AG31]EGG07548.1 hypothetical protein MELLADRAFT_85626 [Melampsora larici-populina 98AG31]
MAQGSVFPPGYEAGNPCEPVEGLVSYNGYTCKICNLTWRCRKTILNHFSLKHAKELPTEDSRKPHRRRDKCQTFYGHNREKFFAVLPHVQPAIVGGNGMMEQEVVDVLDESDVVTRMILKLEEDAAQLVDHGPDSTLEKEQANWIYVTGIHTYIELLKESGKTIEQLVVAGDGNERVEVMVRYIAAWIDKTMKRLHETGQLIKRMCMAETSEMEDNKGLMPLQEKASVIKYAQILASFMYYLICQAEDPVDPEYQLYNVTKNEIMQLRNIAAPMELPPKVPGQGDDLDFSRITNNPLGKQVSKVLCSVFQAGTGGWCKQYQTPPMQFLAFSTLKIDGSYHDSTLLTHLIAAMQYGTRLAFAEQYLDTPREPFNPDADPLQPIKDDRSRFEFLRKNGPEALPDTTYWADAEQETLEVENKRVTISGIRNCIHIQQKMADADLAKLLEGCKMPAFDLSLYKEEPHSRKPFTNFLDHSGDEHRKYGHHLLKEWVRRKDVHGLLNNTWKTGLTEDTSIYNPALWKKSAMLDWLDMYDRLQERLYFLYHVASGQPLRGTEEMTTLVVNTRLNQRNIYLRSGRFAFLTWYHKSQNISGKNKPRLTFLPRRHSLLWFYYLAFLRPTAISRQQGDCKPHDHQAVGTHPQRPSGIFPLYKHSQAQVCRRRSGTAGHLWLATCIGVNCRCTYQRPCRGVGSEKRYKAASEAMHRFWEIDGPVQTGFAEPPAEKPLPAGELLEKALEKFTGQRQAGTRTPFQADWLTMVLDRNYDMLVHTGITVVVQPLTALVAETSDMLKDKGIKHLVYKAGSNCVIEKWHRVVVCTTDVAAGEKFYSDLQRHKVNRVIIDEAHCYEDNVTFRSYSTGVARLRQLNAPSVFMTATMQVGHEEYLYKLFCITNVKDFREPTGRPELQFHTVKNCKWEAMISQVGKLANQSNLADRDRNILFIKNKKECNNAVEDLKKLYPDLPITKYYSKLPDGEGAGNVKHWRTTPKCLMIATNDTDINKCFQEAGQAGRDLEAANVWLFETGKPEKGSFAEKLMESHRCIAETFSEVLDGEARNCKQVGCPRVCGNCMDIANQASRKRPADKEPEVVMPGTRPMYLSNVKRARVEVNIVDKIGLAITNVRKQMAGLCGYCLAKDKVEKRHGDGKCNKVVGCARCTAGNHWSSRCEALLLSKVLERNGNAAYRLCHFCGLGDGHGQDTFHNAPIVGTLKKCDSGLQNALLVSIIKVLKTNDKCLAVDKASVSLFQQWLGSRGWLGCPWANMVTLFIVFRDPEIREIAKVHS